MSAGPFAFSILSALAVAGCCTVDRPCTGNWSPRTVAAIARAMHDGGYPPIKKYGHQDGDQANWVRVWTSDGEEYVASFDHGKWTFEKVTVYVW